MCVKWCLNDALVYEVREEEVEEGEPQTELQLGVESLVDRFGMQKLQDTLARMAKKR
jgi:benzoyl-CoA reductase subunit BamC